MKYKYCARTGPTLRPGATNPMPDAQDVENWLDTMATQGWEFVGMGTIHWNMPDVVLEWWIFRRPMKGGNR
jgi:hypothetical protein